MYSLRRRVTTVTEQKTLAINVPVLTRVEGEGALDVTLRAGKVEDIKLRIFEPPRLFEKLLEGRDCNEVIDAVARICGICPVAYQMSAVSALESIAGITVDPWVDAMRRVFYCGEWIESHSLHIHLLAAPDFLGYESAPEMARDHAELVRRGLRLQALGNELVRVFGGRSVHPVGACIGGFHHAPAAATVAELCARIGAALPAARALVQWTAALELPADEQQFTSVAIADDRGYPFMGDRLVSDTGLDISIADFENRFEELQVPHSTALHALLDGKPYLVGPLARMNLFHHKLPQSLQSLLHGTGVEFPSRNMYHSIVARAVEILYALEHAMELLRAYQVPGSPRTAVTMVAGTGFGASEAPRGVLWHRYTTAADGSIVQARIVPPTSQNQARIEEDLRKSLADPGLLQDPTRARLRCETVIRNYDPCISCATHFLDLRIHHR